MSVASAHRVIGITAVLVTAVSVVLLVHGVGQLSEGWVEVPQHWWSSLPMIGIVAGAVLGWLSLRGRAAERSQRVQ